jgi:hypothetical protein
MDVATAVAERDYPQLGAGWNACQSHMITRDGGLTYQFEPSYPNRMQSDQRPVAAHRRATQGSPTKYGAPIRSKTNPISRPGLEGRGASNYVRTLLGSVATERHSLCFTGSSFLMMTRTMKH